MARYKIKDGEIARSNPFCPRCGSGVFLADKGDWWSCGKCGDRYSKTERKPLPRIRPGKTSNCG